MYAILDALYRFLLIDSWSDRAERNFGDSHDVHDVCISIPFVFKDKEELVFW